MQNYAGTFMLVATLLGSSIAVATSPSNIPDITSAVAAVEQHGYQDITEISLDDHVWEVEALKNKEPFEMHLDPTSGKIIEVHADEAHPALTNPEVNVLRIVKVLKEAGYTGIKKVEFEGYGWEAEAFRAGQWREIRLTKTGTISSDQVDD